VAYTKQNFNDVCALLEAGKSLRAACRELGLTPSVVLYWTKENKEFLEQYTRAREVGYRLLADEIIEISDEVDVEAKHEGEDVRLDLSATAVARNRLRVDSRKWMLSKMLPKIYGDKLDMNHGVQPDSPLVDLFKQLQNTPLRPANDTATDG
jgi:hypothetical protein